MTPGLWTVLVRLVLGVCPFPRPQAQEVAIEVQDRQPRNEAPGRQYFSIVQGFASDVNPQYTQRKASRRSHVEILLARSKFENIEQMKGLDAERPVGYNGKMNGWRNMQIRILKLVGHTNFVCEHGRWFCRIGHEPWTHQSMEDAWASAEARFTSKQYA